MIAGICFAARFALHFCSFCVVLIHIQILWFQCRSPIRANALANESANAAALPFITISYHAYHLYHSYHTYHTCHSFILQPFNHTLLPCAFICFCLRFSQLFVEMILSQEGLEKRLLYKKIAGNDGRNKQIK